jgi:hypothetical protein
MKVPSPGSLWQMVLVFVLAALLLSGCSAIRLGYGQADTIAVWMADEYFDLDARQKQEFLARFERLHEWHRYEQLPEYVSFLNATKKRLQGDPGREDVLWFIEGLKARYRLIASRAAGDAADILATLAPAQLDALQRQLDKDNRKFVRKYQLEDGIEDQKEARANRNLKQITDWAGSLTRAQEQKITAMLDGLPLIDSLRLEDRRRRQREFLQLLELRGDKSRFTASLRHWLLDWEQGRSPQYDRLLARWWEQRVAFYLAVYRLLTPAQRAIALHRLQDYIEDFQSLSQRSGRVAVTQ